MMDAKYGVWFESSTALPPDNVAVLAVKETKNGNRDLCFARYFADRPRYDAYGDVIGYGAWITSGSCNNIVYWMPLPEIPQREAQR